MFSWQRTALRGRDRNQEADDAAETVKEKAAGAGGGRNQVGSKTLGQGDACLPDSWAVSQASQSSSDGRLLRPPPEEHSTRSSRSS